MPIIWMRDPPVRHQVSRPSTACANDCENHDRNAQPIPQKQVTAITRPRRTWRIAPSYESRRYVSVQIARTQVKLTF